MGVVYSDSRITGVGSRRSRSASCSIFRCASHCEVPRGGHVLFGARFVIGVDPRFVRVPSFPVQVVSYIQPSLVLVVSIPVYMVRRTTGSSRSVSTSLRQVA
jgi:hypothetical protein